MKSLFAAFLSALLLCACTDHLEEDIMPNSPDASFLNASFSYVSSTNQYGVSAASWAGKSQITFYYISDSEEGDPQGRIIWNYGESKTALKAWWRLDKSDGKMAIFGESGTAGFLSLLNYHPTIKENWRAVHINENGNLIIEPSKDENIRWELERVNDVLPWSGE